MLKGLYGKASWRCGCLFFLGLSAALVIQPNLDYSTGRTSRVLILKSRTFVTLPGLMLCQSIAGYEVVPLKYPNLIDARTMASKIDY